MTSCIQCTNETAKDSDYCASCEEKIFKSIGGWLYLPAIGLIVTIISYCMSAVKTLNIIVTSYSYIHGNLKWLIFVEFIFFVGLFLLAIYVASLFVRKMRELPRYYIVLILLTDAFLIFDVYTAFAVLDIPVTSGDISSIVRGLLSACIWIPYFLKSVRVKRTFVR